MEPLHHVLHTGFSLDLGRQPPGRIHVLRVQGRGVEIEVPAGWTSVCWSMRGALMLASGGHDWTLPPGRMQVWRDAPLHVRSLSANGWLALCAPLHAWDAVAPRATQLFPWRGRQLLSTASLLAHLARGPDASRRRAIATPSTLLSALVDNLLERQEPLHGLLPRCNGRTLARRRQTLLRMLRVRHAIDCSLDVRLDQDSQAATANYSPCHLIRVFRAIFDETPFEYATRLRAERAWQLVRDTRMPVCEITEAVGFESQSAFCRAFKNIYGMTTSEARHRLNDDSRAAAPRAA